MPLEVERFCFFRVLNIAISSANSQRNVSHLIGILLLTYAIAYSLLEALISYTYTV